MTQRSPRKKWRLKVYPSFEYWPARSMKEAYDILGQMRRQYLLGLTNVHEVDVEMDDGEGWGLWERVTFPDRTAEATS